MPLEHSYVCSRIHEDNVPDFDVINRTLVAHVVSIATVKLVSSCMKNVLVCCDSLWYGGRPFECLADCLI